MIDLLLTPTFASLVLALGAVQDPPELELEEVEIQAGARTVRAEVGYLTVPQLHGDREAGTLELAVLVRRCTAPEPGPPMFFLNGIPESATDKAGEDYWDAYLEHGDVILFDQRGAGRSRPRLTWDQPPYRAECLLADRATARENMLATGAAMRSFAEGAGVSLSAFNTRESAQDVDALRAALGYEHIHLVGHSAGTHLGFEVLRRFEDRIVRFASLGTAGPNDIHSLPSELDEFLRRIAALAASDPRIGTQMPDLYERLERVLDAVERKPLSLEVRDPRSGERVELLLGRHGLQFLLVLELGDPEELALFPRLVFELEQGRTDVLTWFVELRHRQLSTLPALLFINRGASGATRERWRRIDREAAVSPFGRVRCLFFPELADALGIADLGDAFRADVESEVPTLFVSGTLDGKTPSERAERVRQGFAQSSHLLLQNGGHNALVQHAEVHARVARFLAGEAFDPEPIVLPELRFAVLEGADPLVDHPALRD